MTAPPKRLHRILHHVLSAADPKKDVAIDIELPGKLGNPALNVWDDPRLDPNIASSMIAEGRNVVGSLPKKVTTRAQLVAWINELETMPIPTRPSVPAEVEATVVTKCFTITGVDGNEIELMMKRPVGSESTPLPCYYHTHGGGMVLMSMHDDMFQKLYTTLAAEGVCVIAVEFRNAAGGKVYGPGAPPAPFPAGLNDCMSGLQYVYNHKEQLAVTKIVCSGESGGGNLAIALALKAKKEGRSALVDGVYAMCPYISGTYALTRAPAALISLRENEAYMGHTSETLQAIADVYTAENSDDASDPLAWPLRASKQDLSGLPPHVISVNELDTLRDEGLAYYRKLRAAGVSARARVVVGTTHGSDCGSKYGSLVPEAADSTTQDILAFIRSLQ